MSDFFKVNFGTENNVKPDPTESKEYRAKQKIAQAKEDAMQEMDQFNAAYEKFKKEVEGLVLYEGIVPDFQHAIEAITATVITPVVFGRKIEGMPDQVFADLRRQIFKSLIDKRNKEENK